jgi:hypothetical protein
MALYFIEIRKTYGKHVYLLTHYFGMPSDTQSVSITPLFSKGGVGDESEDEAKDESDSVSEAIR